MRLMVALALLPVVLPASESLPGCEARPEVRRVLEAELDSAKLNLLTGKQQKEVRERVLNDLIARYPRELQPYIQLIDAARWEDRDALPELQARYKKEAAEHPDDPVALFLAAQAIHGTDTPESIRLAEKARKIAPEFARPALLLADIYADGKFLDKKKATGNLAVYLNACPTAVAPARWAISKVATPEMRVKVAKDLRAKLSTETDPVALREYETLWGFEFRTRPPAEHDALRRQVAEDVKRLEKLNPKPDAAYFSMLRKGYKQSGASPEAVSAFEDRILRETPASDIAYEITNERWKKDHKEPEDQKDAEAWGAHNAAYRAAVTQWVKQFKEVPYLKDQLMYATLHDQAAPNSEVVAQIEAAVARAKDEVNPSVYDYLQVAQELIDRRLQPQLALELLHQAGPLIEKQRQELTADDTLSDADREERAKWTAGLPLQLQNATLQAAMLANKPEIAVTLHNAVEGPEPKEKDQLTAYWAARARLALIEKRKADALAYYQSALHARTEGPRYVRGVLRDDLGAEAKALWKELGGTDVAYEHWIARPKSGDVVEAEGRWEKPTKELAQFELTDLSGTTWRLKQLEGKSLLINLWATWCGPCKAELPKLQKLYDSVKARSDIQVLTFNMDDDLGLVAPFMKEKGYSFPVLMANEFVQGLLGMIGIPQNWIVDPAGKWRWSQIGYDSSEPDWVGAMVKRLESVKKPEKAGD